MSPETLEQLYRRFAPFVHARASRIVGREAEAVVQELFVRLVDGGVSADADDDGKVSGWILSTSTELALARLRRRPRDDADWEREVRQAALAADDVDALLSRPEFSRRVLADLDRRTQEVVVLVHFEGLTPAEAARALHLPAAAIEQELARYRGVASDRLLEYRGQRRLFDEGGEA